MSSPSRPLAELRFALVGAGAVGGTLALWLEERGARCAAVAARPGSARAAALARRLGSRALELAEVDSSGLDLLLLAVPDGELSAVARALAARRQAPVALHVAGSLGAAAIAPLAAAGSAAGGFHPLRAFAGGEAPSAPPAGIFFALGGAPEAVALGRRLATALGGAAEIVADDARPLYHLVATLLAGGLTTIAATALEIRRRAGLPEAADAGYALLAREALAGALAAGDPALGITGPAARGDLETFALEARALARIAPEALPAVIALARETLRHRARLGLSSVAQERLARALEEPDLLDLARDRVLTSERDPHG